MLGKWFNIPIKGEFLQITRTDEHHNKANPPALWSGWGGTGLEATVWPPVSDDTALDWELIEAGLTSLTTCPKSGEVKTALSFWLYNASSCCFLTTLKEKPSSKRRSTGFFFIINIGLLFQSCIAGEYNLQVDLRGIPGHRSNGNPGTKFVQTAIMSSSISLPPC